MVNFAAKRSRAIVLQAIRAKCLQSQDIAIAIWQPWLGEFTRTA